MGRKLSLWALDIHWAFNAIAEYAARMEKQIERVAQEDREQIEVDPPDEEEFGEVWGQHDWLFNEALPRNFRYSCVVLLLTTIEATLIQICQELKKRRNLPHALRDWRRKEKGSTLEKMLTYIRVVAGIALPDHQFDATRGYLIKIRHCIAHAAGNVDLMANPSSKAVREAVLQLGFRVSGEGYIEIDKDVCGRLIEEAVAWESAVLAAASL